MLAEHRHRRDGSGGDQHALARRSRGRRARRQVRRALGGDLRGVRHRDCECVDVEWGRAVEPAAVRAAFAARARCARRCFVQASRDLDRRLPPDPRARGGHARAPERLIVVDGISGVGVHDLPMDAWGLDVVVSGSQKSWLLPPGLAFIALSERAQGAVQGREDAALLLRPAQGAEGPARRPDRVDRGGLARSSACARRSR